MLDEETLRVTLGTVSVTVLMLFYLGVYRPTRSSFSGWWTVSLVLSGMATAVLMWMDGGLQAPALLAYNVLSAAGVTCVWFATRSLRRRQLPLWLLAVAPAAVVVPTFLQSPATNVWAGNGLLFIYMGVVFSAGALELWLAWAERRARSDRQLHGQAIVALLVSALAASALALFYLVRAVIFAIAGPTSEVFHEWVGPVPTTGMLLICLVAVTFSVSAVGWNQQTEALRERAARDDLTGMLARREFEHRAQQAMADARSSREHVMLVMADLDHFKSVNDAYGHAGGGRALVAFAAAVEDSLRPTEIAGRLGGEEFGMVLREDEDRVVVQRLAGISAAFAARSETVEFALPTVSYGYASSDDGESLSDMLGCADLALYRAEADGRDRAVRHSVDSVPFRAPRHARSA